MLNFTSQFSSSIPASNPNISIGLRGIAPPHTPFSFGGAHIPQTTPTVGGLPPFHPRSNLGTNAPRWSGPSFMPTSSVLILNKTFGMKNPSLSSRFTPRGGLFHTLGNPQPRGTPSRSIFYNPHQKIPTGMVPNHPLMNQSRGGSYNLG